MNHSLIILLYLDIIKLYFIIFSLSSRDNYPFVVITKHVFVLLILALNYNDDENDLLDQLHLIIWRHKHYVGLITLIYSLLPHGTSLSL